MGTPAALHTDNRLTAVQELRAVVRRTDALPIARRSPHAVPVEFAEHHELESWWWRL
ncbi:hypothetical protein [Streptomyces sp. NPDC059076]|uniref:hypothetical protein n=1 Tax=unclassified Streptomyces TaxID=2593676 RepID=UPI0036BEA89E